MRFDKIKIYVSVKAQGMQGCSVCEETRTYIYVKNLSTLYRAQLSKVIKSIISLYQVFNKLFNNTSFFFSWKAHINCSVRRSRVCDCQPRTSQEGKINHYFRYFRQSCLTHWKLHRQVRALNRAWYRTHRVLYACQGLPPLFVLIVQLWYLHELCSQMEIALHQLDISVSVLKSRRLTKELIIYLEYKRQPQLLSSSTSSS